MNATLLQLALVLVCLGGVAATKAILPYLPAKPEPSTTQKLAIAVEQSLQSAEAPTNVPDEHSDWAAAQQSGAPMQIVAFLRAYPESDYRYDALILLNEMVDRNTVTRANSTDLTDVNQ